MRDQAEMPQSSTLPPSQSPTRATERANGSPRRTGYSYSDATQGLTQSNRNNTKIMSTNEPHPPIIVPSTGSPHFSHHNPFDADTTFTSNQQGVAMETGDNAEDDGSSDSESAGTNRPLRHTSRAAQSHQTHHTSTQQPPRENALGLNGIEQSSGRSDKSSFSPMQDTHDLNPGFEPYTPPSDDDRLMDERPDWAQREAEEQTKLVSFPSNYDTPSHLMRPSFDILVRKAVPSSTGDSAYSVLEATSRLPRYCVPGFERLRQRINRNALALIADHANNHEVHFTIIVAGRHFKPNDPGWNNTTRNIVKNVITDLCPYSCRETKVRVILPDIDTSDPQLHTSTIPAAFEVYPIHHHEAILLAQRGIIMTEKATMFALATNHYRPTHMAQLEGCSGGEEAEQSLLEAIIDTLAVPNHPCAQLIATLSLDPKRVLAKGLWLEICVMASSS